MSDAKHRLGIVAVCVAAACIGAPAFAGSSQAQATDCAAEQSGGAMSEGTYRVVQLAIEDLSADKFADAEARLLKVTDRVDGDYERAVVYQTLGFVYAQQQELKKALAAFEEALATKALPREPQEDLLYNVGQLYVADEQYERGIATLKRYLQTACKTPPASAHMLLANAYAQAEQYAPALEQVNRALEQDDQPQESWLQLKLALHYQLKQFSKCAETLVALIGMAPETGEYWKQLSGVLMQVEKQEDALAVLALAGRQGMLQTESDIKNLASIYLSLEIPYKAGLMLERGIEDGVVERSAKNFQLLSDAWISAHEWDRAETALRKAAELAETGDLWQRLAQVLIEKEDWVSAQKALERAISKGVSDAGQAQYLLGVAAYQAGNTRAAQSALMAATRDPDSKRQAQQWLDHIAANNR